MTNLCMLSSRLVIQIRVMMIDENKHMLGIIVVFQYYRRKKKILKEEKIGSFPIPRCFCQQSKAECIQHM